jgi:hypothetical protein
VGVRLILVGCVATKRLQPVDHYPKPTLPAKDLYCSPLFEKRRRYAELAIASGRAQAWAILSALFKTVHPDQKLPGYDCTMSFWRKGERPLWATQALQGVKALVCGDAFSNYPERSAPARCERREFRSLDDPGYVRCSGCLRGVVVEIHAGAEYVDELGPMLEQQGAIVELPLAGLQIGEQLSWYKRRLSPQLRLEEVRTA